MTVEDDSKLRQAEKASEEMCELSDEELNQVAGGAIYYDDDGTPHYWRG